MTMGQRRLRVQTGRLGVVCEKGFQWLAMNWWGLRIPMDRDGGF